MLRREPRSIYCTIKYCSLQERDPKEELKVWTFARSTIEAARPQHIGPDYPRKASENSGFAALIGCNDRKNKWMYIHRCFACNNLTIEPYDDTKADWETWYISGLVFPLRYRKRYKGKEGIHDSDYIMGFLTFDSLKPDIFLGIPSIFDYKDEPGEYEQELAKSGIYHTGGIIADTIATAIMLERRLQKKTKTKVKEVHNGPTTKRKGT